MMQRITNVFLSVLVLGALMEAGAATDKYRVLWRDNPMTTAVIGWVQKSGADAVVYYGPEDKGTNHASYPHSKTVDRSASQSGMSHKFARLSGLTPNSNYYFVIRDNDGVSTRMWFKTAPADSSTDFTIVAGGDSRNNRTPRQKANRMVGKLRPLCVLFGGDMINDPNRNIEWEEWWDDWQQTRSADGRMYPIVAARGNHENSNAMIQNMFDTPNNVYWAMDVGGKLLRLYTLNTEISVAGDQTAWLTQDLDANNNRVYKIVQYHHPIRPHESGKGDQAILYNNWAGIFHKFKVNLAIESHAHVAKTTWPLRPSTATGSEAGYIRDDATGTVYTGEGTWGAPLRTYNRARSWTRSGGSFNQFNWIHVSLEKMTHRKVKVDNVDEVGTVSDANPFGYPSKLDVFTPAAGAVVTFNSGLKPPVVVGVRNESPLLIAGLNKMRISTDQIFRSRGDAIRFLDLPEGAQVRIYNLNGELVRTLGAESHANGAMEWNGRNTAGNNVSFGLYHMKVGTKDGKSRTFVARVNP